MINLKVPSRVLILMYLGTAIFINPAGTISISNSIRIEIALVVAR